MKWRSPMGQPCDEGVLVSTQSDAACPRGSVPWILAATILGSSLAFIDGTVVNLALPALQANLVVFAGASMWCGLASSVNILIVARCLQGIGGALLVPGSLAILGACFAICLDALRFIVAAAGDVFRIAASPGTACSSAVTSRPETSMETSFRSPLHCLRER